MLGKMNRDGRRNAKRESRELRVQSTGCLSFRPSNRQATEGKLSDPMLPALRIIKAWGSCEECRRVNRPVDRIGRKRRMLDFNSKS